MMYSSPINTRTGREITGLFPGSELGWTDLGQQLLLGPLALSSSGTLYMRTKVGP